MGNSCSTSHTRSEKDLCSPPAARRPEASPGTEIQAEKAKVEDANLNSADKGYGFWKQGADGYKFKVGPTRRHSSKRRQKKDEDEGVPTLEAELTGYSVEPSDDTNDKHAFSDESDDDQPEEGMAERLATILRLTAIWAVTLAGAFYLSRKIRDGGFSDQLAAGEQMSYLDSQVADWQKVPASFAGGCVSCGMKSVKTVPRNAVHPSASVGAIKGRGAVHAAYAKGDDFTPGRVYHNYWAARDFPSNYYSKSETIRDYRFTRIFGW